MIKITKDYFSLRQIGESGQCFRLMRTGENGYSLIAFGKYLEAQQRGNEIIFYCSEKEYEKIWKGYFDLDADYEAIITSVDSGDTYLRQAVSYGKGLRILRQDLWEMIVSFIISQQNNIRRIRKCIETICERYGEARISESGVSYHAFPEPEALALASQEELQDCNLGYRSRYIRQTAGSIVQGEVELERLQKMDYGQARAELKRLCGVGDKVADCICLFALHHLDAFPRDTHINQVLERRYRQGFPFDRYRGCAGVMQQYLFYYDLNGEL
ncbi:MAG: 8-oxoguanine DNA glycosylase [Lachnospiraceae bacterium]|nr:8-oxoguanine DNA glycosylase [Lachnospiraceae bacterium]